MSPSPPDRSTRVAPTAPLQSLPYDSLGMDTESFKRGVLGHLEYTLAELPHQVDSEWEPYVAVALAVRDRMVERWVRTQDTYYRRDAKRVYYLSLEYLMGRTLGNGLINMGLLDECAKALHELGYRLEDVREAEWDARWWSPIINAEHLAMRDRVGLVDLSAFALFDVTGPNAVAVLERLCVNKVDVAVGRTVYTPMLSPNGGILADLTIMRLALDRFRVVTGGGMGMRDRKIFQDALNAGTYFTALTYGATNATQAVYAGMANGTVLFRKADGDAFTPAPVLGGSGPVPLKAARLLAYGPRGAGTGKLSSGL